jgi:hypothetical protein
MMNIPRGGRGWQLITVAVIVVPWLFRDELAVRLDGKTRAAEEIQTALYNEEQRAADAADRRETSERLRRIEIMVSRLTKESSKDEAEAAKNDLFTKAVKDEAEEMLTSVNTLDEHLQKLSIEPRAPAALDAAEYKDLDTWLGIDSRAGLTKEHLTTLVNKVRKTAEAVANADPDGEAPAAYEDWPLAATALHAGYATLSDAARQSQEGHSFWAGVARLLAWVFTALGALMIGDWSKLLGGSGTADSGDKPA